MQILKNALIYVLVGFLVNGFCYLLDSDFLSAFLHNNIITICITLVAITSAVRGIILGKITDLTGLYKELDFSSTFKELRTSIYEQVAMVFLAILALIIYGSKNLPISYIEYIYFSVDSILISILSYNIYILCDTGTAIIDLFIAIDNKNKSE